MALLPDPFRGRAEEAAVNRHPRGHGETAGGAGASGGLDVKEQRRMPRGGGARGLRATTIERGKDDVARGLLGAGADAGASGDLDSVRKLEHSRRCSRISTV
jgi:hypothetical protein